MEAVSPYSDATSSPSPSTSTPPSSLLSPSSHPRKRTIKKARSTVPRPPNAFILFRSDFWAREKQKPNPIERNHRDISRIAGHCWKQLDAITKQYYQDRALQLRDLHRQVYPTYKFKPAAKKARVAKKEPRPSDQNARCASLASTVMPELMSLSRQQEAGPCVEALPPPPLEPFYPLVGLIPSEREVSSSD
jgi:HMG (high mobility group) box